MPRSHKSHPSLAGVGLGAQRGQKKSHRDLGPRGHCKQWEHWLLVGLFSYKRGLVVGTGGTKPSLAFVLYYIYIRQQKKSLYRKKRRETWCLVHWRLCGFVRVWEHTTLWAASFIRHYLVWLCGWCGKNIKSCQWEAMWILWLGDYLQNKSSAQNGSSSGRASPHMYIQWWMDTWFGIGLYVYWETNARMHLKNGETMSS